MDWLLVAALSLALPGESVSLDRSEMYRDSAGVLVARVCTASVWLDRRTPWHGPYSYRVADSCSGRVVSLPVGDPVALRAALEGVVQ